MSSLALSSTDFESLMAPLDPIEVHTGIILNERRMSGGPAAADQAQGAPDSILEQLLIPALLRTPCAVAYSGGRDSSALLSAATHVARKHGLDDPIPLTFRFDRDPRTMETEWQELTVRHLGLADWQTMSFEGELEVVGPLAQSVLRKHGLYWPPNAHNLVPLLRAARGGSLLTGNGGDELFTAWEDARVAAIRRGRVRPGREDLKPLAVSFLPKRVRQFAWERFSRLDLPWLRPRARRALRRRWAADCDFYPAWRAEMDSYITSRYREVVDAVVTTLARDEETLLIEPFSRAEYIGAVARSAPPTGFASRDEAMHVLFGKLLPPEVPKRSTKAVFTNLSIGPVGRAFVRDWDGSGVDHSLVDVDAVRDVWSSEGPRIQSLTMLQAAWLASAAHL